MSILWLQVFNGLSLSSVLLLIALGLAITFGLMNVINMAHGEFIMIGAYTTFMIQRAFQAYLPADAFGYYFAASLLLAFLLAGAVGWLMEILLIRFLYGRPLDSLLATWGVSLVLQQLARTIFGAPNVAVKAPAWLDGGLALAPDLILPYKRLFIIGLACLCILAVFLFIYRTRSGRNIQAVMQNRQMASCLGISTQRVDTVAFSLGSGLAGVAGCALTLIGPIGPSIGTYYIVDAFMVVVLGGIGKLAGTVFGALGIGAAGTVIEYGTSATIGKVIVFTLIIAFLQWRPSGLVTTKSRALD
ncbi:urea ABC transporter permease subunit UrtB [Paenibacillus filicis]|uniref:Urea ABC transporter permease subunit UrtB n=1 Tax=Paenibacillus filicis TaxID=669464 RepID=A0ABU9DNK2_9BACL